MEERRRTTDDIAGLWNEITDLRSDTTELRTDMKWVVGALKDMKGINSCTEPQVQTLINAAIEPVKMNLTATGAALREHKKMHSRTIAAMATILSLAIGVAAIVVVHEDSVRAPSAAVIQAPKVRP